MTRRLRAVPDAGIVEDANVDQCLLCGERADTFADLCDHCAGVVQAVADRVTAGILAQATVTIRPGVPGQLTVDGQEET